MTLHSPPPPDGKGKTLAIAAVVAVLGGVIGYTAPQILNRDPQESAQAAGDEAALNTDAQGSEGVKIEDASPEPLPPALDVAAAPPPPDLPQVEAPETAPDATAQAEEEERPVAEKARRREANARPSFNCRFARSETEKMICNDAELARVDRRLHSVFEEAMSESANPRRLRREQDRWLEGREALGDDADAVMGHYENRIEELEIR